MVFEKHLAALALAIALAAAGSAGAQTSTDAPADEAPATEPVAADAAPEAAEPPAEAAPVTDQETATAGDPAAPEVMEIVRDTFGDWEVRCAPNGDECFMYQLAMDSQNNPVAEVSILKLPESGEAAAGVTMVTPLGTLLQSGVVVQVDQGEARQYPFNWCSQVGCFARFGLTQQTINGMKRGKAATVMLASVAAPETPVRLNMSLTGFTAAYDSLTAPELPATAN
jgi:invasion protein IalB